MKQSILNVTITGIVPLLMHSSRLANPMNEITKKIKAISSKRKKTDDDLEEMSRLEWQGSAYIDKDGYPCINRNQLEGVLQAGARKARLGQVFKSSVFVIDDTSRLRYGKSAKMEELWGMQEHIDIRSVVIQSKRIMRTRPIFPQWSATFDIGYYPDQVDKAQVIKALEDGGLLSGVGDFRPYFGRFTTEVNED